MGKPFSGTACLRRSLYITVWSTRAFRRSAVFCYGCYAWLILVLVVIPVAILLLPLPGIMRRRRLARVAARLVCRLTRSPIHVTGRPIPDSFACVVVSNHASYLDGIVLTATLPPQFAFLIKSEMAAIPVTGFVLKRLGSEFVDRENPRDRHRMARRLIDTAGRGSTLAVFPEGTFDRLPGLKTFHPGAFIAAMRGGLPVVPVVITGSREKMPGNSLMPRPGRIRVHICEPIPTERFETPEALLAATRKAMLTVLDEPDLDPSMTRGTV